jgi:hypothetical protein
MVELRKKGGDTLEYHTVSAYAQHSIGVIEVELQALFMLQSYGCVI